MILCNGASFGTGLCRSANMVITTRIEDDEVVYRRVRNAPEEYAIINGVVRISANAFRDPKLEPSVVRSLLCNRDPNHAIKDYPDHGVVSLVSSDIRKIKTTVFDKKRKPVSTHATDVLHRPNKKNRSHAIITALPSFPSEHGFNRLKEALSQLATKAGFTILPQNERKKITKL